MRIVQALITHGMGGAERLFIDLSAAFINRGHDVLAICPKQFKGLNLLKGIEGLEVEFIDSRWDRNPWAEYQIRRAVTSFGADLVHAHLARTNALFGAALKNMGIPVVANIHDYVKVKYYKNIIHFVPGTDDLKSHLCRQMVPSEKVTVIPHFTFVNGVQKHVHDFRRQSLVAFGRFDSTKGFDVLLHALSILAQENILPTLFLGGDGFQRAFLEKLIKDLGLSEQVILSGWVKDAGHFLANAPFFVMPSRHEAFGIVVLEAMACGNCIISTRSQGPSVILTEDTAYLCKVDDPIDMAQALKEALGNPGQAAAKASSATRRLNETFAADVVIKQYEDLFSELIRPESPL